MAIGSINVSEKPTVTVVSGRKLYSDCKIIFENQLTSKDRAFPACEEISRGTNRGLEFKRIKARRTEISDEKSIKVLFFLFLEDR